MGYDSCPCMQHECLNNVHILCHFFLYHMQDCSKVFPVPCPSLDERRRFFYNVLMEKPTQPPPPKPKPTTGINRIGRNFHQFRHLLLLAKVLSTNFLSCVNGYMEDMATFTTLVKIYSIKYFCFLLSYTVQVCIDIHIQWNIFYCRHPSTVDHEYFILKIFVAYDPCYIHLYRQLNNLCFNFRGLH